MPAANFDGENVLAAMWTETLGADDDDSARLLSSQNKQPFHRSSFFTLQNKRQSCVKFAVFHNIVSSNWTKQIQEESLANLRW